VPDAAILGVPLAEPFAFAVIVTSAFAFAVSVVIAVAEFLTFAELLGVGQQYRHRPEPVTLPAGIQLAVGIHLVVGVLWSVEFAVSFPVFRDGRFA
jgi:hypothetical protein